MRFNVAIKTKDRSPRKNYLQETVKNLRRAGVLDSPLLGRINVIDSGSPINWIVDQLACEPGYPWQIDVRVRTLHQNAARCIEVVGMPTLEVDEVPRWAMVLEDDLDFCDEFLEQAAAWLEDHKVDTPQMYVLGANYDQIQRVVKAGGSAWAYPVGAFYGAQALVWREVDAAALAAWLGPDPNHNGVRDHGHDLKLQHWGREQGLTHFVASAPCMVQHIGEESGIHNRFFQFPWGGRDWRYERRAA